MEIRQIFIQLCQKHTCNMTRLYKSTIYSFEKLDAIFLVTKLTQIIVSSFNMHYREMYSCNRACA